MANLDPLSAASASRFSFSSAKSCHLDFIKHLDLYESASEISGMHDNHLVLRGTSICCTIAREAGKWENRLKYIEKVIKDIVANCKPEEELALIPLGADGLLCEFIIGRGLIENGFAKLSFFLIDPVYKFSSEEEKNSLRRVREDFNTAFSTSYFNTFRREFDKKRIHYLSRAQNVETYLTFPANIALLECLPPYGESLKDLRACTAKKINPNDFFAGDYVVPAAEANAVAFVPLEVFEKLQIEGGFSRGMPLAVFQSASNTYYYINWGCKLQVAKGTYRLLFSCEKEWIHSIGGEEGDKIKLPTGETIPIERWIPLIREKLEQVLSQRVISPETRGPLLETLKKVIGLYLREVQCFFLADYTTDREEMLSILAAKPTLSYRKQFTLIADEQHAAGYNIFIEAIK